MDQEPMLVFDNLDIDLVIKVLNHTLFSPFFVSLMPVFYFFQGAKLTEPAVVYPTLYLIAISAFWTLKWLSKLYRNQGSIFSSPKPLDWGEQIILITGGSSGIGHLLANTLAVRNVAVVVLDVEPLVTENHNITFYKCNVSDWNEVEDVSRKVIEEVGEPTIIINNAGVVQGKLLLDLSPNDINQTFGVNTLAHFWILKAFLPGMLRRKAGHIVSMASVMGYVGAAQMTDYNSSKAAIVSLHESLRYELDKRYKCPQIRTTLVCPGHTMTPMFSSITFPPYPSLKFLLPSLQPVTVVKEIITALDESQSQIIMTPFWANAAPYLRHLPSFVRDLAQSITGADYGMQDFVKITGRRKDEPVEDGVLLPLN
ncbi:retinal short-chain dehydrogenase reductase [Amanita rubescens]|nr:retinal short-chain dehydrogenase reductase [Amanita rubescens]